MKDGNQIRQFISIVVSDSETMGRIANAVNVVVNTLLGQVFSIRYMGCSNFISTYFFQHCEAQRVIVLCNCWGCFMFLMHSLFPVSSQSRQVCLLSS